MLRVTVIIPVYNAERFLRQAVASALQQPETGEVLLIEDGSTDGSLAVCEELAKEDARVRLLRHDGGGNRGAAETRNVGLRRAACDLVAFLDADDYYLPGRFERAVAVLAQRSDLDGVYDAVGTAYDAPGMREWWASQRKREMSTLDEPVEPNELFETLVSGQVGSFHTNGIVVRRSLFEVAGEFDSHLLMTQDSAMWIRMAAVGRLAAGSLRKPVAMRRLHGDNRIVRQSCEHREYAYRMWSSLASWARARRLPGRRCRVLEMAVVSCWCELSAESRFAVDGSASAPRFLMGQLFRHPWLGGRVRFWKLLGRALGGSMLRRRVRVALGCLTGSRP